MLKVHTVELLEHDLGLDAGLSSLLQPMMGLRQHSVQQRWK